VRLLAAGVARDVADGLRRAEAAIAEGVALARLDALLAA
jgi:anthranilate phosphoribosyltransferase